MKSNVLLIVVDCLRYDRVTPECMPFLTEFGKQNTVFSNFWSVSHCSDPAMTALLTGKWPDELKLYSTTLTDQPGYTISEDVEMLAQTAKRNGYAARMISNLSRWYRRGVDDYCDNRGWHGSSTFKETRRLVRELRSPWFLTTHDDSCHTLYRGGSYNQACGEVDTDLMKTIGVVLEDEELRENTYIFITADHGEALGEHGIDQHGYDLWPCLTHLPLIWYEPGRTPSGAMGPNAVEAPFQHVQLYNKMYNIIVDNMLPVYDSQYAHIVGRVPKTWHRAVTDGKEIVMWEWDATSGELVNNRLLDVTNNEEIKPLHNSARTWWAAQEHLRNAAGEHLAQFDMVLGKIPAVNNEITEEQLRNLLGYPK